MNLSKPIALRDYVDLVTAVRAAAGDEAADMLRDCFMPEGNAVEPGYEDSLSHYAFLLDDWKEARAELPSRAKVAVDNVWIGGLPLGLLIMGVS